MAFYKNVASQKVAVFAWDTANDTEKTGDAGNITAQISKDGGATAASNDVNPTELDATDAPGVYIFDLTQAESNCDLFVLFAKSSTADIKIEPVVIYSVLQQTGDSYARLGAPAGASVSADVAAVKATADAVEVDTTSIESKVDTVDGVVDTILVDTADMQPKLGTPAGADISADIAAVKATADAIETDTQDLQTQIGTAGAGLTDVGGMSTTMKAEVNAEVADVLTVDTITDTTQQAPPDAPTFAEMVRYLYNALTMQGTQTATEKAFYNASGTKVAKKTVSDDGTTYTETKAVSGA